MATQLNENESKVLKALQMKSSKNVKFAIWITGNTKKGFKFNYKKPHSKFISEPIVAFGCNKEEAKERCLMAANRWVALQFLLID